MPVILFIPIFIVLFLVAVVVFIIWAAKNGGFSTKRDSKITLREGETPILATEIVWFRKSMYMNKNKIPRGVLDITDQRLVYTREFGEKYEFALEKNEIESVDYDGGMRVTIHAKDGSAYSFNTSPAKDTLDALEQLGVPVAR